MSLDPKAKEWCFLSRSSYINLSQISLQMAESHVFTYFIPHVWSFDCVAVHLAQGVPLSWLKTTIYN